MRSTKTLTEVGFDYSGSLDQGLIIHKRVPIKIKPEIVRVIRDEIRRRTPVLMGACYKPLVADSVGETLSIEYGVTPAILSYVIPLLVEEGFCRVSGSKPFKIYLNSGM